MPKYTNQAMNRDIKELCKLAGINEEIRVTTYKAMKPYIDIVDSIKIMTGLLDKPPFHCQHIVQMFSFRN